MKVKLLGCKSVDFTKDGETISGTNLFFSYSMNDVTGQMTDKCFIRSNSNGVLNIDPKVFIGKDVNMEFSRKGGIVSVTA